MRELTQPRLRAGLLEACRQIVASEPMLTELDLRIGDGDHGMGMKIGFSRLSALLEGREFSDIRELMRASGLELLKTMGGASGMIFSALFAGDAEGRRFGGHLRLSVYRRISGAGGGGGDHGRGGAGSLF